MKRTKEVVTSTASNIASSAANAAINYGVSSLIAPMISPIGAAIFPPLFTTAGQVVLTSATAAIITNQIVTCAQSVLQPKPTEQQPLTKNENPITISEEWDDTDAPLQASNSP